MVTLTPLFTNEVILARCRSIARWVERSYPVHLPLIAVIQEGGHPFARAVIGSMQNRPQHVDVLCKSYDGKQRLDKVSVKMSPKGRTSVWNEDVLILDDIVDSGQTVDTLEDCFMNLGAKSVTCVPLIKRPGPNHRLVPEFGFEVPSDKFLVGFGMDLDGKYRKLDHICYV